MVSVRSALLVAYERSRWLRNPGPIVAGLVLLVLVTSAASAPVATAQPRLVYRDAVTVGADGNGVTAASFDALPRQNLRYTLEVVSGCPEPEGIPSQCPPPVGVLEVSINGETVFAADGTIEPDRVAIPVEALSLEDNELVITAAGNPHSAARIRILARPERRRHRTGPRESRS